MDIDEKKANEMPKETPAYRCYKRYVENFLGPSGLVERMRQCRDFVAGKQYSIDTIDDMPKPKFNLCKEYAEKVSAKILEAPCSIEFVADSNKIDLSSVSEFYRYLLDSIDDEDYDARALLTAIIDGQAVVITSYDRDSIGIEGIYKGAFERLEVPFEDTFWENPYCENTQKQQYEGYVLAVQVGAAKQMVEGDEKTKEEKKKLIVPENYFDELSSYKDMDPQDFDSKVVMIYTRFFRVKGEVFFEVATKYCNLFEHPHPLNPAINDSVGKNLAKEYEKMMKEAEKEDPNEEKEFKDIPDYAMDYAQYTLFEKAVKTTMDEHQGEKGKFSRYPMEVLRPYPVRNRIYGESGVSHLIANQKLVNLIFVYITLIMQYHAMPKWLAKPDSLKGQQIDNSPNQLIFDYTPITSRAEWGVTRLGSGDAINSNLVDTGEHVISLTRNIGGFADIVSENVTADTSGYALEQKIHQANLTLEQPQKRYWQYKKNKARTDLLFMKHYVSDGKYFIRRSESEIELQERYRDMSMEARNAQIPEFQPMQGEPMAYAEVSPIVVKDVSKDMFDADFDVVVEVEQGIARNEISEAENYDNLAQYWLGQNVDMDKLKAYVMNSPSFSKRTKQRLAASLEVFELGQVQMKNAEIEKYKQIIEQLMQQLKTAQGDIRLMNQVNQAQKRGFEQSRKEMEAVNASLINATGKEMMTESEVKSQNAKGVSGGKFSSPAD